MTINKKKKKEKFVDDGRVIASMNVEGMPGYRPEEAFFEGQAVQQPKETLTGEQTRWAIGGAILAGLVVVGVMSVGIIAVALLLF